MTVLNEITKCLKNEHDIVITCTSLDQIKIKLLENKIVILKGDHLEIQFMNQIDEKLYYIVSLKNDFHPILLPVFLIQNYSSSIKTIGQTLINCFDPKNWVCSSSSMINYDIYFYNNFEEYFENEPFESFEKCFDRLFNKLSDINEPFVETIIDGAEHYKNLHELKSSKDLIYYINTLTCLNHNRYAHILIINNLPMTLPEGRSLFIE